MKRFLLWDYPRAVWQYDVMVALILAFIFLTPRNLFRDQPRAYSITMLPAEHGANVYWMEPELLTGFAEDNRAAKASELLRSRHGRSQALIRLEPIFDNEKEIKGFLAYTRP
jgi:hypothetical protein